METQRAAKTPVCCSQVQRQKVRELELNAVTTGSKCEGSSHIQRSRNLTPRWFQQTITSLPALCVFWWDAAESARSEATFPRLQCALTSHGEPARWPSHTLWCLVRTPHMPQDFLQPSVRSHPDQKQLHQHDFKKDVLPLQWATAYISVCRLNMRMFLHPRLGMPPFACTW